MPTISKSVTVEDGGVYTVNLNLIPDGSTVTPVNDIQTWLHCGDIWDKDYTTLDQVLADNTTLLALISSNNAVDYMVRSTDWSRICSNQIAMAYIGNNDYCADTLLADGTWCAAICASEYFESVLNVKVPTMTSNTAPSGECFAYTTIATSGREPYRAFDKSTAYWQNGGSTVDVPNNIGYKFTERVKVNKVSVSGVAPQSGIGDGHIIKSYKLYGSNNYSNWNFIKSVDNLTKDGKPNDKAVTNDTAYQYWALGNVLSYANTRNIILVKEIQFYGRKVSS